MDEPKLLRAAWGLRNAANTLRRCWMGKDALTTPFVLASHSKLVRGCLDITNYAFYRDSAKLLDQARTAFKTNAEAFEMAIIYVKANRATDREMTLLADKAASETLRMLDTIAHGK